MAEGIFNKITGGNHAESAGMAANPLYNIFGSLAAIMDEEEIPYANHVSTPVSAELLKEADIVLAMEAEHLDYLKKNFPTYTSKVFLLTEFADEEGDIRDPIGQPETEYRKTFARIEELVKKVVRKLELT